VRAGVLDGHVEQRVAGLLDVGPEANTVQRLPPVSMKSLVTKRTVSLGPTGVRVPVGPFGAFEMPSMTGVVPLQWKSTLSPDTCGKRPVAIAGLHTGLTPLSIASVGALTSASWPSSRSPTESSPSFVRENRTRS
jgi:hypothetical protein